MVGDDGRRYKFGPTDCAHRGEPGVGMYVDFEHDESRPVSIFPVPGASPAVGSVSPAPTPDQHDRNKYVAALLAFLLGTLGIHRFYWEGRDRASQCSC